MIVDGKSVRFIFLFVFSAILLIRDKIRVLFPQILLPRRDGILGAQNAFAK